MTQPTAENEIVPPPPDEGWKTIALFLLTFAVVVLCAVIAAPFLFAVTGAVVLAVVTARPHDWLRRRLQRPVLAAGLSLTLVTFAIIGPSVLLVERVSNQALTAIAAINSGGPQQTVSDTLERHPRVHGWLAPSGEKLDLQAYVKRGAGYVAPHLGRWLGNSIRMVVELVVMLFILFFLYRDREQAIAALHRLIPLRASETSRLLQRVGDTIFAAALGRAVIALMQGCLAGLAFWVLGVPSPFLWGVLTSCVAMVPPLGAFLVWIPMAVYLGVNGHWVKAALLVAWGSIVVSTVDNLLFPILVGARLRLHTGVILIAVLGGIALFGVPGIVLGPVAVAVAEELLAIWRGRTVIAASSASS
jgi:predicted PurR-regulated permease PerM